MPPVGSWPGGLVSDDEPSPPSLPAAQTVTTPSAARARCSCTVAELGSKAPPPVGPYELLVTLIGGQVLAGTPAPQGAAWCSSTQFSAESAPTISRTAPVEMSTRLAPGAAPCSCVPSVSVVGRPATMPFTCVPWPPPEIVSVSIDVGTGITQSELVFDSSRQTLFRLATTALPPPAFCRNGWVESTPESMTATETPLPSSGSPFAPVSVPA